MDRDRESASVFLQFNSAVPVPSVPSVASTRETRKLVAPESGLSWTKVELVAPESGLGRTKVDAERYKSRYPGCTNRVNP
jgi:hypothetical protein